MFGDRRLMGKAEDIPLGVGLYPQRENLNELLPGGLGTGYELISFEPREQGRDPVVLRRWSHILYQWPEGYLPDWVDVLKVCTELGLI